MKFRNNLNNVDFGAATKDTFDNTIHCNVLIQFYGLAHYLLLCNICLGGGVSQPIICECLQLYPKNQFKVTKLTKLFVFISITIQ